MSRLSERRRQVLKAASHHVWYHMIPGMVDRQAFRGIMRVPRCQNGGN
jgi:hypothetical protein